jgi:cell shape-determining protein MreC
MIIKLLREPKNVSVEDFAAQFPNMLYSMHLLTTMQDALNELDRLAKFSSIAESQRGIFQELINHFGYTWNEVVDEFDRLQKENQELRAEIAAMCAAQNNDDATR